MQGLVAELRSPPGSRLYHVAVDRLLTFAFFQCSWFLLSRLDALHGACDRRDRVAPRLAEAHEVGAKRTGTATVLREHGIADRLQLLAYLL